MASSDPPSLRRKVAIGALFLTAIGLGWRTVASLLNAHPRVQAMTAEQAKADFQRSEAIDRENWEKMWKAQGRPAPKAPAEPQAAR